MHRINVLLFCVFAVFLLPKEIHAEIPIGKWRTHFSYQDVQSVAVGTDVTYVLANQKLFEIDSDNQVTTWTSLNGLNGHDLNWIEWSDATQTLLLVYSDGNMDLLSNRQIVNMPDYKNKAMTADKSIHNVCIIDGFAYLSTGIGLLKINLSKREITETFNPSVNQRTMPIYDAVFVDNRLVLLTDEGLFEGDLSLNLADPSNWHALPSPVFTEPLKIAFFSNRLFLLADKSVYSRSVDALEWQTEWSNRTLSGFKQDANHLYVYGSDGIFILDESLQKQEIKVAAQDIAFVEKEAFLLTASGSEGLLRLHSEAGTWSQEAWDVRPEGPDYSIAWNGLFYDNAYYTSTGGRWGDRYFKPANILRFDGNNWTTLVDRAAVTAQTGLPFWDILNVAIDPYDSNHFFATSWGEGLYEFREGSFYALHTNSNSALRDYYSNYTKPRYIRIDGATFDASGNLWMLNSLTDSVIKILKPDGTWLSPYYSTMPKNAPTWNGICMTSRGQMWMNSLRVKPGVFVLDNNRTLENTSDDQTRWFSSFTDQDGNTISPWAVTCITEDQNGSIWIGTQLGPFVVGNPSSVFASNFRFSRIKIPRNDGTNNADYLMENVHINCIAVDGANRKWIGTEGNGVYLLSADGVSTLHQFSTQNSPLPSDYILSIAIHPETGEVFMGTDQGLVSYRSDATEGKSDYEQVYVFPNPVRPEYQGVITVTGLMENSQVRITDLKGNVMSTGTSLGGQYVWDGRNRSGNRVATGIYLVYCASEDGLEYANTRFMVLN
ncbi:MAG: two-component regulator propeller domain-containing protein [Bacteroidales bacterium]